MPDPAMGLVRTSYGACWRVLGCSAGGNSGVTFPLQLTTNLELFQTWACRVSSDLHEWRNDLGAVSTGGSANL